MYTLAKSHKIRNLVVKDSQAICLEDVTNKAIELSHSLVDLEYDNKVVDIKKAKKAVAELEKITNALGRRIRQEVFDEVMAGRKEKNKNFKGDVTRFKKKKE
ncbi:hypothetical protein DRO61_03280 [Candidatus Bathyarchaeota archaeon]|nr:MAG: hypothetical protein DRO61_03280 [Candidatus Bathyarchaeota archaeon]